MLDDPNPLFGGSIVFAFPAALLFGLGAGALSGLISLKAS